MANITIKISQLALDAQISTDTISNDTGNTVNGALDAALTINNLIRSNYYYYTSASTTSTQVTYFYPDGATIRLNGHLDYPSWGYGPATITKSTFTSPGKLLIEYSGNNQAYFYSNGKYDTQSGTINSINISILDSSLSLFGQMTSTISGGIIFDSNDNLSGTISSIKESASKILKSSEISGKFTINSGNISSPYGTYSNNAINHYSNISGTLSKYTENYYDGSLISADFSSSPLWIDNNESIGFSQLSDPGNLPGNDKIDIELPNNIYREVVVRTGSGNDSITLAGGGGNLNLDTGSGNDTVIIKSGDHHILTGSGNDTITGGQGIETLAYDTAQSNSILNRTSDGKLNIQILDKTDTAYNVEWLEFSDGRISVASLPISNTNPTGTLTITGNAIQGQKLTAANTLADADGLGSISYQWLADDVNIESATAPTFTPTQAQVGKAISVRISYTDKLGTAETVTSSATAPIVNVNDAPTGTVTIGGTASQGQTLTAGDTLADADGLGSITYQWMADGSAINGATGSTLTLTQAQVGKAISVRASYTDGLGAAESKASTATAKVANVNDAPTGTVSISGTASQGQTLTAANDLADADGLGAIGYQWLADGSAISGATALTFTLGQAQVGKAISVRARYTDKLGTTETVTSSATAPTANVNDAPTGTVSISGTSTQGQKLTAVNTLADIDGLGTISYQWLADGSAIDGATASTLTLTQAQVGQAISVRASYTDGQGMAESKTSTATAKVANVNDAPTGMVIITGTASQGQVLNASSNLADADGLGTLSYQWMADGVMISGATASTLALTQAQVGKAISVKASYTDLLKTAESVTSAATTKTANINDTGTVTISALPAQGRTLTAVLSDADGVPSTGIGYQWLADGIAINRATSSTFAPTQAEVGKTLSVKASYKDLLGTSETVTGTATAKTENANDAPIGTVTIGGTAAQGRTLTAANTLTDADGLGTISYQWLADGSAISGATASTLTLTQDQVGKAVSVKASYTDGQGTAESKTSIATAKVANVNDAPTGTVSISGTASQGQTLTATNDLTDADGLGTIAYQWLADGSAISGATGSTLILTQAQVGKAISVKASYTDLLKTAESVTSIATTTKVANVNDAPTGTVTITGTATQDQKLTASNKLADADGLGTVTYQWLADGSAISGATAPTFTLTQAQVGKTLSVKASYTDGQGTPESMTSSVTSMVASANKTGTAGNDLLIGGSSNDTLTGLAGDDVMNGGLGNDTLIGGAGSDQLTGGSGNDSFKFSALAELGLGTTARDVITDFKRGEDKIDLSAIDTDLVKAGDQKFVWVTDFGTTTGQVRFAVYANENGGVLYLNTDTDADAEYEILLTGVTTLAAADLVL